MSTCPVCQKQNSDDALICDSCGAQLGAGNAESAVPQENFNGQEGPAQNIEYPPGEVLGIIKKAGSSRLFLWSAIFLTANLLPNLRHFIYCFYDSFRFNLLSILPLLTFFAADILMCIGLWQYYKTSRSKKTDTIKGLPFIKASLIYYFVIADFYFMIKLPLTLPYYLFNGSNYNSVFSRNMILSFIISVALFSIIIYYAFNVYKVIGAVKNTIRTQKPIIDISRGVTVISYILAGVFISIFLYDFIKGFIFLYEKNHLGILEVALIGLTNFDMLFKGLFVIFITIVLTKYRKAMKSFIKAQTNAKDA